MKKILNISLVFLICGILITGCGKNDTKIDLSTAKLDTVMDTLYAGINEDDMPMVETRKVEKEDLAIYIGTDQVDVKECYVSEAMIGSIAHSVVLLRVNNLSDVENAKKLIKDNANPRKWICVEAEKVIVDSVDDTIVLIMSDNDLATKIHENYKKLK